MLLNTGKQVIDAVVADYEIQRLGAYPANWVAFATATEAVMFIIDNPIGGLYEYRAVALPDVPIYQRKEQPCTLRYIKYGLKALARRVGKPC